LNSSTIHNAHVAEWQNTKCETPESIADLENYILYYGRIENQSKDIQFLLDAYANSQLAKKGFDLIIMGKGPDEEELSNYATGLACKNQIHFLPFQPNPFGIIKKARLVALTSKYEGFPMVLIESLATGIPIVSLDFISGPAEVIQHEKNGLLVKNRSITAFASALERMCFDDAFHQTCKQNACASVEAFSANQIARKWDNLLRSFSK
jgi:glycosyltransferase involved in cell wall biosynthesis